MSFQLLNRILLTLGTERILLMCTYNQNNDVEVMEALEKLMKKDFLHVISLNPFTEDETMELLHKYLPELNGDEQKLRSIYQMTDGNAFFLMELVNLIRKGYTWKIQEDQQRNKGKAGRPAGDGK